MVPREERNNEKIVQYFHFYFEPLTDSGAHGDPVHNAHTQDHWVATAYTKNIAKLQKKLVSKLLQKLIAKFNYLLI